MGIFNRVNVSEAVGKNNPCVKCDKYHIAKTDVSSIKRSESDKNASSLIELVRKIEEGADQNIKPNKFTKMSIITGAIGPIVGLASVVAAAQLTPGFDWFAYPLSFLLNGPMSALFAAGVVTAGVSGALFAAGLMKSLPNTVKNIAGTSLLMASSAALSVIGLSSGLAHTLADSVFFFAAPAGLVSLGLSMLQNNQKVGGKVTLALAAASTALVITSLAVSNAFIAPYEILAAAAFGAWITGSSMLLSITSKLKSRRDKKRKSSGSPEQENETKK